MDVDVDVVVNAVVVAVVSVDDRLPSNQAGLHRDNAFKRLSGIIERGLIQHGHRLQGVEHAPSFRQLWVHPGCVYGHDSDYDSVYDYVQVQVQVQVHVHFHELAESPAILWGALGPHVPHNGLKRADSRHDR